MKSTREKSLTKKSLVEVITKHHKGLSISQDPGKKYSKNHKKISNS